MGLRWNELKWQELVPTIFGLKLPVVKARVPKQNCPREWRVSLKILGGCFSLLVDKAMLVNWLLDDA
jgi:hypothetical protein